MEVCRMYVNRSKIFYANLDGAIVAERPIHLSAKYSRSAVLGDISIPLPRLGDSYVPNLQSGFWTDSFHGSAYWRMSCLPHLNSQDVFPGADSALLVEVLSEDEDEDEDFSMYVMWVFEGSRLLGEISEDDKEFAAFLTGIPGQVLSLQDLREYIDSQILHK